jgi:hypothetical protein
MAPRSASESPLIAENIGNNTLAMELLITPIAAVGYLRPWLYSPSSLAEQARPIINSEMPE